MLNVVLQRKIIIFQCLSTEKIHWSWPEIKTFALGHKFYQTQFRGQFFREKSFATPLSEFEERQIVDLVYTTPPIMIM